MMNFANYSEYALLNQSFLGGPKQRRKHVSAVFSPSMLRTANLIKRVSEQTAAKVSHQHPESIDVCAGISRRPQRRKTDTRFNQAILSDLSPQIS